jgi:pyruvate formate lyase activating enzyme
VKEARFWERAGDDGLVRCRLCPRECKIAPGKTGFCGQRENRDGTLYSRIYARATSAALDPIEKKPLYHFMPGSAVLSLGTVGCSFKCPFCQNWSISQMEAETEELLPEAAVGLALRKNAAGIAYTYNEPMIWLEYVIDTATLAREKGLVNVLVTNGYVNEAPLAEALQYVDALNIDVKSFDPQFYKDLCKGELEPVLARAEQARKAGAHVEITNLVIPGYNDRTALYEGLAKWIAEKLGPQTPLHFSAHFPRYRLKAPATSVQTLTAAREVARKYLKYVYLGNVNVVDGANTKCSGCGAALISRVLYEVDPAGLDDQGRCQNCGEVGPVVVRPSWRGKAKG